MYVMLRKVLTALLFLASCRLATGPSRNRFIPLRYVRHSKGVDTINVGNLNVHLTVPIINKAGRGFAVLLQPGI